jgi:hypothetical protein
LIIDMVLSMNESGCTFLFDMFILMVELCKNTGGQASLSPNYVVVLCLLQSVLLVSLEMDVILLFKKLDLCAGICKSV